MTAEPFYLVDSNVFITAKNLYYAFDICPGFWDSLVHAYERGWLRSIDKVQQELFNWSEEELTRWIKNDLTVDFFIETSEPDVVTAFSEVMFWAQQEPQFFDSAKADFATKADGWLVAYAMVHGATIATNELANPDVRKEVKLGNACDQFGVQYENTFAMLRNLQIRFVYGG